MEKYIKVSVLRIWYLILIKAMIRIDATNGIETENQCH